MLAPRGIPLRRQLKAVERPTVQPRPAVKAAKINLPPRPQKSKPRTSKYTKLEAAQLKTKLRRRAHHFRVLATIAEMIPNTADVDGHASGTLRDKDIIQAASGVSGKDVIRAFMHWQRWRVLWIYWKGARTRDIRFDRGLIEKILATQAAEPRKVLDLLRAHKAVREAVAPWPLVPKQTTEVVHGERTAGQAVAPVASRLQRFVENEFCEQPQDVEALQRAADSCSDNPPLQRCRLN